MEDLQKKCELMMFDYLWETDGQLPKTKKELWVLGNKLKTYIESINKKSKN